MDIARRQKLVEKIQSLVAQSDAAPPVVELDEFFDGNIREGCIAPNQVGGGRPGLAELYGALKTIRARPDVQAVLVGIHGDWIEALTCGDVWPAGENVFIYTSARRADVEKWIADFQADGVVAGWPYGKHPAAPEPPRGSAVYAICWD